MDLTQEERELIEANRAKAMADSWVKRFDELPKPINSEIFLKELKNFLFATSEQDRNHKHVYFDRLLSELLINVHREGEMAGARKAMKRDGPWRPKRSYRNLKS